MAITIGSSSISGITTYIDPTDIVPSSYLSDVLEVDSSVGVSSTGVLFSDNGRLRVVPENILVTNKSVEYTTPGTYTISKPPAFYPFLRVELVGGGQGGAGGSNQPGGSFELRPADQNQIYMGQITGGSVTANDAGFFFAPSCAASFDSSASGGPGGVMFGWREVLGFGYSVDNLAATTDFIHWVGQTGNSYGGVYERGCDNVLCVGTNGGSAVYPGGPDQVWLATYPYNSYRGFSQIARSTGSFNGWTDALSHFNNTSNDYGGASTAASYFRRIGYSPSLGFVVAGTQNVNNTNNRAVISQSTDAITWVLRTSGLNIVGGTWMGSTTDTQIYGVASNDIEWLFVGRNGDAATPERFILASTDLLSWQFRTTAGSSFGFTPNSGNYAAATKMFYGDIRYYSSLDLWVAAFQSDIEASTDGIVWQARTQVYSSGTASITSLSRDVSGGAIYATLDGVSVLKSTDSIVWQLSYDDAQYNYDYQPPDGATFAIDPVQNPENNAVYIAINSFSWAGNNSGSGWRWIESPALAPGTGGSSGEYFSFDIPTFMIADNTNLTINVGEGGAGSVGNGGAASFGSPSSISWTSPDGNTLSMTAGSYDPTFLGITTATMYNSFARGLANTSGAIDVDGTNGLDQIARNQPTPGGSGTASSGIVTGGRGGNSNGVFSMGISTTGGQGGGVSNVSLDGQPGNYIPGEIFGTGGGGGGCNGLTGIGSGGAGVRGGGGGGGATNGSVASSGGKGGDGVVKITYL